MKFKIIPNEQTPAVEFELFEDHFVRENYILMCKFMKFARTRQNCVGLAANQVSLDGERLMMPFFALKGRYIWQCIINPKVVEYKGEPMELVEGCLTWLHQVMKVERFPVISVTYWDLNGDFHEALLYGLDAQIFQHEYDHLMGKQELFFKKGV